MVKHAGQLRASCAGPEGRIERLGILLGAICRQHSAVDQVAAANVSNGDRFATRAIAYTETAFKVHAHELVGAATSETPKAGLATYLPPRTPKRKLVREIFLKHLC